MKKFAFVAVLVIGAFFAIVSGTAHAQQYDPYFGWYDRAYYGPYVASDYYGHGSYGSYYSNCRNCGQGYGYYDPYAYSGSYGGNSIGLNIGGVNIGFALNLGGNGYYDDGYYDDYYDYGYDDYSYGYDDSYYDDEYYWGY